MTKNFFVVFELLEWVYQRLLFTTGNNVFLQQGGEATNKITPNQDFTTIYLIPEVHAWWLTNTSIGAIPLASGVFRLCSKVVLGIATGIRAAGIVTFLRWGLTAVLFFSLLLRLLFTYLRSLTWSKYFRVFLNVYLPFLDISQKNNARVMLPSWGNLAFSTQLLTVCTREPLLVLKGLI